MAFSASEFKPFQLEKIERINHNVSLFRFKFPEANDVSGLSVASCVVFRAHLARENGEREEIVRPYTPTSDESTQGHVDFVIKDYPQGNMSRHVHSLKVGDSLDIKGPFQKYNWESKPVDHVGMVAGGTGITPMLQLLRKIFTQADAYPKTQVSLVFANQEEKDVLFKAELDEYQARYPDRFKVHYVVKEASEGWKGHQGYVTEGLIQKVFHAPEAESAMVFVCGPPPMMEAISGDKNPDKSQGELRGYLKSLGFPSQRVYKL
ncbi:hypothetical protein BY458DRAFT_442760 [Sporodiniella umbellata]|nr:hypothetical protein BY458DRAFT_442760 [Sporodiniella umbellata]